MKNQLIEIMELSKLDKEQLIQLCNALYGLLSDRITVTPLPVQLSPSIPSAGPTWPTNPYIPPPSLPGVGTTGPYIPFDGTIICNSESKAK